MSNAPRKRSVNLLFLIVHAEPIAHALAAQLKSLMKLWSLLRCQDCVDSIFPARENSFRFAQIHRAKISQFIINLLQNRPDFLVLIGRELHLRTPAIRRVRKESSRIAVPSHFVFGRSHHEKSACHHAHNKSCQDQESDLPSI